jgi:hypothetical protein
MLTKSTLGSGHILLPSPSMQVWTWKCQAHLLEHALKSSKISKHTVDERVRNVLGLVKRCARSGVAENQLEGTNDTPETSAFLRRFASESIAYGFRVEYAAVYNAVYNTWSRKIDRPQD